MRSVQHGREALGLDPKALRALVSPGNSQCRHIMSYTVYTTTLFRKVPDDPSHVQGTCFLKAPPIFNDIF